jgi:hypothetical protein
LALYKEKKMWMAPDMTETDELILKYQKEYEKDEPMRKDNKKVRKKLSRENQLFCDRAYWIGFSWWLVREKILKGSQN